MNMKKLLTAAAVAVALATPVLASAFWGGTVINIAATDTLKVRAWPAASSTIIDAYPDGAPVSLLGRCKNNVTNVSFWITGGQSAAWKYNKMKQPNVWCRVSSPSNQLGWVRGKYVWPE
jgi:Bacterial SH3 domain